MNRQKLSVEYLVFGLSSILFSLLVWLAVPFSVYAIILGIQSLRRKGPGVASLVSISLGAIGIALSLAFLFQIMLPDILREHGVFLYW